jgi:D-psicose/D-tagatose/L-ribulose 3-epimerase
MKAGMCMLLWSTHVTEAHLPLLAKIKAAGFDGVEIPVFEGKPAHFAWLRGRVADEGLGVTAVGVIPDAAHNPISADAAERRGGQDHLDWLVDCASELGAEVLCGPYHQPLGVFSGAGASAAELGRLVEAHRAMADRNRGLVLAIEPLNRFECYVLNTAEQAAAHVAAVGRPNFGYLYDTFHANIEERDPVGVIAATVHAISHVHISENDRGAPGFGHIDHAAAIRALKAAGYDGWFTVEAFGQALPDLAAATRVWRPLFDSEDQVVTAGARVIRAAWDN